MTNQEINIAIAESVGFYQEKPWLDGRECWGHKNFPTHCGFEEIPDYLNDLNAMHEVERTLDENQYIEYTSFLFEICDDWRGAATATAKQRAEAYLKTIGKWKGGSNE